MARKKNPFGKGVTVVDAYATYRRGEWVWKVLKTYKTPKNEEKDPYARWFVAAKSPMTYGEWEYGDTYAKEVLDIGFLDDCCEEWEEEYVYARLS